MRWLVPLSVSVCFLCILGTPGRNIFLEETERNHNYQLVADESMVSLGGVWKRVRVCHLPSRPLCSAVERVSWVGWDRASVGSDLRCPHA